MKGLFDSHCHLDDERFDEDREALIASLPSLGVSCCTCVGSDFNSSERCVALAARYPFIYAAAGVHPHEAKSWRNGDEQRLTQLLAKPKTVALGEIGLDYYYDFSPRDVQIEVFLRQMSLAKQADKPMILHIRDAHGDMLRLLQSRRSEVPEGIVHCYTGSAESVKEYLDLGLMISFSGSVTFKNASKLVLAAAAVPLDRLLIETDSPYLSPEPVRGRRNMPGYVRYVCEKLAALYGVDPQELADITRRNAKRLYRIDA